MANLNMNGSYELTEASIDRVVKKKSTGNYALGFVEDKVFYVKYIGRSDDDLNKRLKNWVGHYMHFKFSYANSPREAFDKECRNYHDFGGNEKLDNVIHPDRPDGTKWKCPYCKNFE